LLKRACRARARDRSGTCAQRQRKRELHATCAHRKRGKGNGNA
jgi:hypothetical protein